MTYTWEQAKADAETSAGMESQLVNFGWQYVHHEMRRGLGLIELKANTPHGEFMSNSQSIANLKSRQVNYLMELGRHQQLLENSKPVDKKAALKMIKESKPTKPPKVKGTEVKERSGYLYEAVSCGLVSSVTGGAVAKKLKAELAARLGVDAETVKLPEYSEKRKAAMAEMLAEKTPADERYSAHRREVATLPETQQQKLERLVASELKFRQANIDAEVREAARELLPVEKARMEDAERHYASERRKFASQRKGIAAQMTLDDYRFLKGLLHPDRAPVGMEEKFRKAFDIVQKLDDYMKAFAESR